MARLITMRDPQFNPLQNYSFEKTLGQGTFGKVKLSTHKPTNEKVAIKILEKHKIESEADHVRVRREINILRKIRHPNIIQLFEIIETELNLYLIMEFAPGGELFEHIVRKQRLEEREAGRLFFQLMNAIEYMHMLGIVHRDLKPENILLDHRLQVKVVDFGLSSHYNPGQKLHTPCGSPCYAAPEMVSGLPYEGLKTDLWSCGIILYAMICGCVPFEDPNTKKLYEKIKHSDFAIPRNVSPQATDLLHKILQKDPQKRISINDIRKHDFILLAGKMTIPRGVNTMASNFQNMIEIDNEILQQLCKHDVNREEAIEMIKNNKHNCITTCYYLLFNKLLRENEEYYKANEEREVRLKQQKELILLKLQQQKIFTQTTGGQQAKPLTQNFQYPPQPIFNALQLPEPYRPQNQHSTHENNSKPSKVPETGGSSSLERIIVAKSFSDRIQSKKVKGKTKSQEPVRTAAERSVPKQMPKKDPKSSQSKNPLAQLLIPKKGKQVTIDSATYVRHKSSLRLKQGSTDRSERPDRAEASERPSERPPERPSSNSQRSGQLNKRSSQPAYRLMSQYEKQIQTQPNERFQTDLSKIHDAPQTIHQMDQLGIQIYKHNIQNRFMIKQQQKRLSKQ